MKFAMKQKIKRWVHPYRHCGKAEQKLINAAFCRMIEAQDIMASKEWLELPDVTQYLACGARLKGYRN